MTIISYAERIQLALQRCLDSSRPYVLWDFPNHSNVGDSAIWVGEIKALRSYFGKPPQNTCELLPGTESLPALPKKTQIIIHGGGNLGDLWEAYQLFRERIVREYPNNKIVQMPQSIYFIHQSNLERCRQVFSAHPNLTVMTRDHTSYEVAQKIHGGQTQLVPDMALAIGAIPRPCEPTVPIVALLRTDQERLVSDDVEILSKLKAEDWVQEPSYQETQLLYQVQRVKRKLPIARPILSLLQSMLFNRLAKIRTHRGCTMLASGQVVITDRLHAHILCSLMKIPHVFIDNSYGKLSGFRKAWNTGGDELCKQASCLKEAYNIAQSYLKTQANLR